MCNGSGASATPEISPEMSRAQAANERAKSAEEELNRLKDQNETRRKEYFSLKRQEKKEPDGDKRLDLFKQQYEKQMERAGIRPKMDRLVEERNEAYRAREFAEKRAGKEPSGKYADKWTVH